MQIGMRILCMELPQSAMAKQASCAGINCLAAVQDEICVSLQVPQNP